MCGKVKVLTFVVSGQFCPYISYRKAWTRFVLIQSSLSLGNRAFSLNLEARAPSAWCIRNNIAKRLSLLRLGIVSGLLKLKQLILTTSIIPD